MTFLPRPSVSRSRRVQPCLPRITFLPHGGVSSASSRHEVASVSTFETDIIDTTSLSRHCSRSGKLDFVRFLMDYSEVEYAVYSLLVSPTMSSPLCCKLLPPSLAVVTSSFAHLSRAVASAVFPRQGPVTDTYVTVHEAVLVIHFLTLPSTLSRH